MVTITDKRTIESILMSRKIPNSLILEIVEYIKPEKLDNNIQDEIKEIYVFNMLHNLYKEFQNDLETYNNQRLTQTNTPSHIEPPYIPFMFEYLVDNNISYHLFTPYITMLENYKNRNNSNNDIIDYYIKSIRLVRSWTMNNTFYDDDDFYINEYDDASDI